MSRKDTNFDLVLDEIGEFGRYQVCEGLLGLSILVAISGTHGNNYFQSYSKQIFYYSPYLLFLRLQIVCHMFSLLVTLTIGKLIF